MASKLWVHEPNTFFGGADKEISEKQNFFVNRSVPKNFQWENFSGHTPRRSLRTTDSEKRFEKLSKKYLDPVLVTKSQVSATKCGPLAKLWAVKKSPLWEEVKCVVRPNFDNCGRVGLILMAKIRFIFFLKIWSTSAAHNSAQNTLYTPLPYIIWTAWIWGFTRRHLRYTTPIQKNWVNCDSVIRFLAIVGHFWAREPNLHCKISDFDFFSVSFYFLHCKILIALGV